MYDFHDYLYCYFGVQVSLSGSKVHFFKLPLFLIFSILGDPKFTLKFCDLERENCFVLGSDVYDFCL